MNLREISDGIPFANLAAWFEGSPPALLVLGDVDTGNVLNWSSSDRKIISTQGPFIVRTIGFDVNLSRITYGAGWSNDPRKMVGQHLEKFAEFEHGGRTGIRFRSKFSESESQTLTMFDRSYEVTRIDEAVSAAGTHRYTNRYWIDRETGFCWKTEQVVVPAARRLIVAMLKPARLG